MATIYDVAKTADVSISSVSRYLNCPSVLRPERQNRIKQAIETLNYKPSPLAVSMRTNKTKNIALIIPSLTNLYYLDLYGMIRNSILKEGYTVNLYTTEKNDDELKKILAQLRLYKHDGVIIAFLDEPEVKDYLFSVKKHTPMVLISSDPADKEIDTVFLDAHDAMGKATGHLLDLGRKKIAYIGASVESTISKEKYRGFADTMKSRNVPIVEEWVFHGDRQHFSTGIAAVSRFMEQNKLPSGIVCSTDDIGIGSIKQLLRSKLRIPQDVAVVAMNNISVIQSYEPELTTIAQPLLDISETAVKLLLDRVESGQKNPREAERIVYRGRLLIRNSTVGIEEDHGRL